MRASARKLASTSPTAWPVAAVAGSTSGMLQRTQGFTSCSRTGPSSVAIVSVSTWSSSNAARPSSTRLGRKRSMPTAGSPRAARRWFSSAIAAVLVTSSG